MAALLLRRLCVGLATLWAISVLVFAGTEVLPGDVAAMVLGQGATPETVSALRTELGLNRPAPVRYIEWLSNTVRGNLGKSLASGRPVSAIVRDRLNNTLLLAAFAALVSIPLSLLLGLLGATFPNSAFDWTASMATLFLISVPEFLVAAVLVLALSVTWKLLPAVSFAVRFEGIGDALRTMALPVLTLIFTMLAHMSRMTRAAILEVMRSPYIEMAVLKGVSQRRIILRHALRNAIGPIANVVALNLGYLISGVVVVETVFNFPGLGRLMVDSVSFRDIPLVQTTVMIFCSAYVFFNLLADVVARLANPRLRG
jgi:peptide/nickel transport system permease protein